VRLAIAHAINLQEIVDIALYGYAQVSPSPISTALPKWYDPKAVTAHGRMTSSCRRKAARRGGLSPGTGG
jgi:peptide/nickel transport system substrate-binding protein